MQKVHSGWLKYNGACPSRDAPSLHRNAKFDRKRLAAAFRASAAAVETFLLERRKSGERIRFFSRQADPLDVLPPGASLSSPAQIALALKQNGTRLPDKVASWYSWYGGKLLSEADRSALPHAYLFTSLHSYFIFFLCSRSPVSSTPKQPFTTPLSKSLSVAPTPCTR
ncbi:MAG TPA: hypothetical protein VF749_17255 [Candidatus Acidoferrum sp.]